MIFEILNLGGKEIGEGLDIQNVRSSRQVENGVDVLFVRGEVANISEEALRAPMIRIALYDSSGEEVQGTTVAPMKNSLLAGTKIHFSAKLPEPSALARRLEVTFTEP